MTSSSDEPFHFMSAPMLNLGFMPPAAAAGAAASAQGQGAASGFEALLAALFGPATTTQGADLLAAVGQGEAETKVEIEAQAPEMAQAVAGAEGQVLLVPPLPAAPPEIAQGPALDGEALPVPVLSGKATPPATPPPFIAPEGLESSSIATAAQPSPAPAPVQEAAASVQPTLNSAPTPQAPPAAQIAAATTPPPPLAEAEAVPATAAPTAEPAQPQSKSQASDHRRDARITRGNVNNAALNAPAADHAAEPSAVRAAIDAPAAVGAGAGAGGGEAQTLDDAAPAKPAEAGGQRSDAPGSTTPTANAQATPAHAQAAIVRGAPETVAHLAANILKKLEGRSTHFDLELEPAGMGRVDVRVEIGANGRLTAAMAFDNPQAAAELRSRSGELAKSLEQAGFDVSGGLSFDMAGDQGGRSRQHSGENAGQALLGRAFQDTLEATGDAPELMPPGALHLSRRTIAGVDIRI